MDFLSLTDHKRNHVDYINKQKDEVMLIPVTFPGTEMQERRRQNTRMLLPGAGVGIS